MSPSDPITKAMQQAVRDGVFPGAVLMVRARGKVAYHSVFGLAARIPDPVPASLDTIYDLASLTKPLATTSAILWLIQQGTLSCEDRIDRHLVELEGSPVGVATVFHLLNHSSGLPAWRPFYERIAEQGARQPGVLGLVSAKTKVLKDIGLEPLSYSIGSKSLYSDLGFILLGLLGERLSGQSLDEFCRERLFAPMKAGVLGFIPQEGGESNVLPHISDNRARIAATEQDPWRGRILQGEVHDENAFAMGCVAGHAGLFGIAPAVLAVSGCWLGAYLGRNDFFQPDLVRRFTTRQDRTPGSSWALGWDTPSAPSSSGSRFSPESFGHLGFTGTSLWIDPLRELEVVLLSNRIHPTRTNNRIQSFRPLIHDLIVEEFIGD